jgi:hypothetical protein
VTLHPNRFDVIQMQYRADASKTLWQTFCYSDLYRSTFAPAECQQIIDLHNTRPLAEGKIWGSQGLTLRDSDIFWIPRLANTEWIFDRLWNLILAINFKYGFELSKEIGQAQLTRYRPGQHYQWHMDLGPGQMSLRKLTAVVELTAKESIKGGGLEVFYGEATDNKLDLDVGDVVVFPSFVMHRASVVDRGSRWSLVLWLNGTRPFT